MGVGGTFGDEGGGLVEFGDGGFDGGGCAFFADGDGWFWDGRRGGYYHVRQAALQDVNGVYRPRQEQQVLQISLDNRRERKYQWEFQ